MVAERKGLSPGRIRFLGIILVGLVLVGLAVHIGGADVDPAPARGAEVFRAAGLEYPVESLPAAYYVRLLDAGTPTVSGRKIDESIDTILELPDDSLSVPPSAPDATPYRIAKKAAPRRAPRDADGKPKARAGHQLVLMAFPEICLRVAKGVLGRAPTLMPLLAEATGLGNPAVVHKPDTKMLGLVYPIISNNRELGFVTVCLDPRFLPVFEYATSRNPALQVDDGKSAATSLLGGPPSSSMVIYIRPTRYAGRYANAQGHVYLDVVSGNQINQEAVDAATERLERIRRKLTGKTHKKWSLYLQVEEPGDTERGREK